MNVLVLKEKHGDRYILVINTPHLGVISCEIIRQRLNSNWYFDNDIVEATDILNIEDVVKRGRKAWRFLQDHSDYEYERVELENLEVIE